MPSKLNPLTKVERNAVQRPRWRGALIRLHFNKAIPGDADPAVHSKIGLIVPSTYSLAELPRKVRKVARERVFPDDAVMRALEREDLAVTLTTSLDIPAVPGSTLPLDGMLRVAEVGDLWENVGEEMEVDAHIAMSVAPARGAQPQDRIQIPKAQKKLNCLRIGSIAITEEGDPGVHQSRKGERNLGPAYIWPLLVWFDDDFKKIKFTKVHAFELNELCIGDPNESEKWNQVKFNEIHDGFYTGLFIPLMRERWSMAKFKRVLKQHVAEDWGNLRTGMPFLPTYCYNKYDPAEHGHGLKKWPRKGIDVAVRCVNHYEADGEFKNLSFRRDIRIVIKEEDPMDEIYDFLNGEIDAEETEDGVKIDSKRLFADEHRHEWEWQLWVMPQRDSTNLYRWTEGDLSQFCDGSPLTRPKDRKVFMEAHVVPKKSEEDSS
ncbi:hypothetical protein PRZ48_002907 [Zasmidium cellare]|uniref:Uncharacterized protein n=1 Tax=Zasmidium cellare TaxID=395010 RepID=A0ABR0EU55_ZASCE|nr:hypothetical protein PRZ48_002907 [Zasmidium cellare]